MTLQALPFDGFMSADRLWLLLLVPLAVIAYVIVVRRRSLQAMRYTNTTVLGQVMPRQSQWLRHVIVALSLLCLLTVVLAWARPLGQERVPRERATVVMVIDISWSMTATDVAPSRLDAAKEAATSFVDQLPNGFNVALVALSGNSGVRLAPTDDHAALNRLINTLQPQDSSAVGNAIDAALAAVAQAPQGSDGSPAPAMIVMLSDGANTNGQSPLQMAADAAAESIPIYTIAYGTDNGYVDLDGQRYAVPPDRQLMQQIADTSGGSAYTADNLSGLDRAYTRIHSQVGYELEDKEMTATAAGLAMIFAFTAAVGAVLMGVRFR
ncbi:MAG: VWA domain-containing protein [Propionibacteriaceae bacterium]|jgi:Ca-activated chloride channel family protein|nr:VWA domain-containing protein [Propionibacteriaceae bacterium]